jgi:7,8-dihydropterin-6-yl-methyl-4-(beta-D-ribofuranosyl)aminobenzene 5'-phosphate synthase
MSKIKNFGEAHNVEVTVLVDNRTDLLAESTDTVEYFTDKPLLAEHGFAALIDFKDADIRILWDAGITHVALLDNMKRLEIDPTKIDKIALSHGHGDHTAAVTDILKAIDVKPKAKEWAPDATQEEILSWVQERRVPLIVHPAAFRESWIIKEDGTKYGPIQPPVREEWEAAGAEVIQPEGPYQVEPGCWMTGHIPRQSFEESGRPSTLNYRQGEEFIYNDIEDDQALIINLKDKGLVIISGCAHSGIVNTVNYAREISSVDEVWGILGGFHLAKSGDEEIQHTIDEINDFNPKLIAPSHCTGFKAISKFADQMPEEFVLGLVGVKYIL